MKVEVAVLGSLSPHLHTPPPFSPSLISLVVSVDVKHHVYWVPVPNKPTVSVDVKQRSELRSCVKVEVAVRGPNSPHGLCGQCI